MERGTTAYRKKMPCLHSSEQGINTRFRARGDEKLKNQYPVMSYAAKPYYSNASNGPIQIVFLSIQRMNRPDRQNFL